MTGWGSRDPFHRRVALMAEPVRQCISDDQFHRAGSNLGGEGKFCSRMYFTPPLALPVEEDDSSIVAIMIPVCIPGIKIP